MTAAGGPAMVSLRRATRDAHQRTDSAIRQGDWLNSPSAYASFLQRTLRFHRMVEAAVAPVAPRIDGLGYADRRRSPLVQSDLAALASAGVFPDTEAGPSVRAPRLHISGPGGALGCLYVVEGAMLGGAVLSRWIESRLGYDRSFGATSFAAHHGVTMIRWRAFGALVEARVASVPGDLALMVAAARTTFAVHRAVVVTEGFAAEVLHA
jgi:heme oxygenase